MTGNNLFETHELTRQAYNKIADKYHELFKDEMKQKEYDRKFLDRFAENLGKNSLICDAGCGPSGHIGRYLYDKGYNVFGFDISDRCIEIAGAYNPMMKFERMDMANMTMADRSLAAIISYYSIIDTPKDKIDIFFQNFYKKLTPRGKLLVVVKEGNSEGFIEEVLGIKTRIYYSLFSEQELENYFLNNGFKIQHLETRKPYDFEIGVSRIYAIGVK
jgi:trans-aconitate methyltransferase